MAIRYITRPDCVAITCDGCGERVDFAVGAEHSGMRRLDANGWRLARRNVACPRCVARETAEAADLAALLAGGVAIARARNVATAAVAEMACTTGDGEEAA